MAAHHWLLIGSVILISIIIILGLIWGLRNISFKQPPVTKYNAPLVWSPPTAGPDPNKNICQLYIFPTTISNGRAYIGTPTFNSNILDNMTGQTINTSCLDTDELLAMQVEHECTAPRGVVDGQISMCHLMSGGVTGIGGTEVYYDTQSSVAVCPGLKSCPGQLSLVSLNYHPDLNNYQQPIYCIKNDADLGPIMEVCNPSDSEQLFRVTRTAIGVNPNSLTPNSPQSGLLIQIYDRNTNMYLTAGTNSTNTIYTPSSVANTGPSPTCTGTNQSITGTNVIMTDSTFNCLGNTGCTGPLYPGYNWAFFPSMFYCTLPVCGGGCTSINCSTCTQIPRQNACIGNTGCTNCVGAPYLITPPQISYIGNINISELPYGLKASYNGLTGTSATVQWLLDNNVQSLYYGGTGPNLILRPFGIDSHYCLDKPYTAQYINLLTYNTISAESVCYADNTLSCLSL